jgi:hypothetical protein
LKRCLHWLMFWADAMNDSKRNMPERRSILSNLKDYEPFWNFYGGINTQWDVNKGRN